MEKKSFPLFRRRTNADKPPQQQQQQQSSTSIPTSSSGGVVPSENGNGMSVLRSAVAATSISGTNNGNSNNRPAVAAAIAASSSRGRSANASSSSSSSSGEFLVSIPPDVKPGENFQVMAGGRIFRVRCPMNSIPGQQVKIALPVVADKNTQDQKRASNEIGGGGGGRGAAGGGSSGNLEALSSSQTSDNSTSSIQQQQQLQHDNPNQTNNDNNNKKETKMFQVIVPRGVNPGSPFALMAGGVRVLVTCPGNATMGDKICFHLPLGLLNQPDGPKSHLAEIILKYDKNGWTRTIRATTDMKFIWTRLDEIGNVDQRTRFDTERSAYVRKMHYVREEDGRVRGWCTLVTPDRVAVDSYVENSEGEKIVTYRDIVSAQMMSYDDKVEWFHATCKQLATESAILLTVRRDNLLGDSMKHLMSLNPMQLRKSWMIRFQDEPGLDAGGLMREWFELVTEQLFTPSYGCWKNNSNNQWQIHPFSGE